MGDMRVIFFVRCHGKPDDELEDQIMDKLELVDVVEVPEEGWGILTIGRQYFHDNGLCGGHPDTDDECDYRTRGC